MKKLLLAMAFIALSATASFAATVLAHPCGKKLTIENKMKMCQLPKNSAGEQKQQSCSVTTSWPRPAGGTNTLTITASCNDCSVQQACDAAYRLLSLLIPD